MRCDNCGYRWQEEWEDFPSCHYPENDPWPAPCEYDDVYEEEENYDEK